MVSASTITGNMLSKKLRELKPEEIQNIAELYSKHKSGQIINEPGIAKSINKEELIANDYSFVPGRYVETIKEEIDEERTKNEIKNLGLELETLFDEFEKILPKVKESIKKSIDLNK
jgi:type I restriction enzyme M protein